MSSSSRTINRRSFIVRASAALSALTLPPLASAQNGERFSRTVVLDVARVLAEQPFTPLPGVIPELLALDYDQYRRIQYRKQAAIWGGTPSRFSVELFAPGHLYTSGVDISVVENGEAFPINIENDTFITPSPEIAELLASISQVAGFRLHYPMVPESGYQDEFVVFQGASYFRTVSVGQNYGLSARGLAIDVAEPTGEEFPVFRKFWIERPSSNSDSIVVHALLDSQRVTGAYRFGIYPGNPTRMEIEATLFARTPLSHIGLGALTSMYMFGSMDTPDLADYRSAVHDSSGLAMLNGQGEYLWRPLNNPATLQVSVFTDHNPKGFGLIQRTRKLEDFYDLEAQYHKRPSAWISPRGDWGDGYVELVEIPTSSEVNDNIVAYWRPQQPVEPGTPFSFSYHLTWSDDSPLPRDMGRVQRSAYGLRLMDQFPQVVIDYTGLPADLEPEGLVFDISFSNGQLIESVVQPSEPNNARIFVTFDPQGADVSEIRIQPKHNGVVIGETWLFRWLER